jgi:hypothetical protein
VEFGVGVDDRRTVGQGDDERVRLVTNADPGPREDGRGFVGVPEVVAVDDLGFDVAGSGS